MDVASQKCANFANAVRTVDRTGESAWYSVTNLPWPCAADSVYNIALHYSSPPHPGTFTMKIQNQQHLYPLKWTVKPGEAEKKEIAVPFFTAAHPFVIAAASTYYLTFDPAPQSISACCVCYSPQIRYRLMSALHTFRLESTDSKIIYENGDVSFVPLK